MTPLSQENVSELGSRINPGSAPLGSLDRVLRGQNPRLNITAIFVIYRITPRNLDALTKATTMQESDGNNGSGLFDVDLDLEARRHPQALYRHLRQVSAEMRGQRAP